MAFSISTYSCLRKPISPISHIQLSLGIKFVVFWIFHKQISV